MNIITSSELNTITMQCIRLISNTDKLRRTEGIQEANDKTTDLFPLLRKLSIASKLQDKRIICVSGLQGAGKTTLMKNFYGIDDDFMNVTEGRGERIPVLITENDVTKTSVYAMKINENAENAEDPLVRVSLSPQDFIAATQGNEKEVMYLEIIVPYKHTHNDGISFMLLPGFEKKNEYWNDLIEFAVNSSDAGVFVFSSTSFSNIDNEDYLKRIEKKFGDNIVYAISGTDMSKDGNAQVKDTCIETLKIKKSESDRVVCVGDYSDTEKNEEWIKLFKSALDKYALYETQVSQRNDKYLYDVLERIKTTLYSVLNILDDNDNEIQDDKNYQLLNEFDREVERKRKELAINISRQFEIAKGKSIENVVLQITRTPWHKELKKILFGPDIHEQYIETQKIIKSSLALNNSWLPDYHLGKAIEKSIHSLDSFQENNPNALSLLMDREEKNGYELANTANNQDIIGDIRTLIQTSGSNKDELHCRDSKIVRAITEVATYYYGLTSYEQLVEQTSGLAHYTLAESKIIGLDIVNGADSSKKFVAGLAGVMGVDIIGDGSVNLISQLATACSISLPVAGIAAMIIVAGGGISVVQKDINRMQRADVESAKLAVCAIYDNIQREALERFDNFTNMVRGRIEDNLVDLSGYRKQIVDIYNAKVNVNNLLDFLDTITNKVLKESQDVGRVISN